MGLIDRGMQNGDDKVVPTHAVEEVQQVIERIPDHSVLDFLVQYFITEVNWLVMFQSLR